MKYFKIPVEHVGRGVLCSIALPDYDHDGECELDCDSCTEATFKKYTVEEDDKDKRIAQLERQLEACLKIACEKHCPSSIGLNDSGLCESEEGNDICAACIKAAIRGIK